jgi:hypothetical protein
LGIAFIWCLLCFSILSFFTLFILVACNARFCVLNDYFSCRSLLFFALLSIVISCAYIFRKGNKTVKNRAAKASAFNVSFFLPRLLITISYVWVANVITEENTKFYYSIDNSTFIVVGLLLLFGTLVFLFSEARQNNRLHKNTFIILNRVIPVFSLGLFYSFGFAIIATFSGMEARIENQANVNDILFSSQLDALHKKQAVLNTCKRNLQYVINSKAEIPDLVLSKNSEKVLERLGLKSARYTVKYDTIVRQVCSRISQIANDLSTKELIIKDLDSSTLATTDSLKRFLLPNSFYTEYTDSIKCNLGKAHCHKLLVDSVCFLVSSKCSSFNHLYGNNYNKILGITNSLNDIINNLEFKYESTMLFYRGASSDSIKAIAGIAPKCKHNDCYCCKQESILPNKYVCFPITKKVNANLRMLILQTIIALAIAIIAQLILSDKTVAEGL